MKRIIAGNSTGKTRELMFECLCNGGIFVCQNALRMKEKANAYGLYGLTIMSYEDVIADIKDHTLPLTEYTVHGFKSPDDAPIYIDEIEGFVQFICLNRFCGYTLTNEE